jgi:hypothetical protein
MSLYCSRCNKEHSLDEYEKNRFCRECESLLKISSYRPVEREDSLEELIQYTWDYFHSYKGDIWKGNKKEGCITYPSIPVLFFGDLDQYEKSKQRIVTVGLNPSKAEFPNNGFSRFNGGEELYKKDILDDRDKEKYIEILSNYFHTTNDTYEWFNSYKPLLNSMNATFYPDKKYENKTIHTDICTPLATSPTWSDCPREMRKVLSNKGAIIWNRLISLLKPHLVLISVKQKHLDKIKFGEQNWEEFHTIYQKGDGEERKTPYKVYYKKVKINDTATTFIHDKPANLRPFFITDKQKRKLGNLIYKAFFNLD